MIKVLIWGKKYSKFNNRGPEIVWTSYFGGWQLKATHVLCRNFAICTYQYVFKLHTPSVYACMYHCIISTTIEIVEFWFLNQKFQFWDKVIFAYFIILLKMVSKSCLVIIKWHASKRKVFVYYSLKSKDLLW